MPEWSLAQYQLTVAIGIGYWEERWNRGRRRRGCRWLSHDLTLHMFQSCDVLTGDNVPGESYVPVGIATRRIGSAQEVIRDLFGHKFVFGRERDFWSDAARDSSRRVAKKKKIEKMRSLYSSGLGDPTVGVNRRGPRHWEEKRGGCLNSCCTRRRGGQGKGGSGRDQGGERRKQDSDGGKSTSQRREDTGER